MYLQVVLCCPKIRAPFSNSGLHFQPVLSKLFLLPCLSCVRHMTTLNCLLTKHFLCASHGCLFLLTPGDFSCFSAYLLGTFSCVIFYKIMWESPKVKLKWGRHELVLRCVFDFVKLRCKKDMGLVMVNLNERQNENSIMELAKKSVLKTRDKPSIWRACSITIRLHHQCNESLFPKRQLWENKVMKTFMLLCMCNITFTLWCICFQFLIYSFK